MPRYIVTGRYTEAAMRGMTARPSDRGAAARAIVEAAGGKLESFYVTTGPTDFSMTVTVDDVTSVLAGLLVAGGAGMVSKVQTQRAFSSEEFTEIQKKAGTIASVYAAPA